MSIAEHRELAGEFALGSSESCFGNLFVPTSGSDGQ